MPRILGQRFRLEEKDNWTELTRSPEIKKHAAATRRLIGRSTITRLLSLITGGYVIWIFIYVIGIGNVGPVATSHERRVALLVSVGWLAITCFFVVPVMAMVYRRRWFRVSIRNKHAQQ